MARGPRCRSRPRLCRWAAACLCTAAIELPGTIRAGDYFVDQSGANGAFPTVQSAVDAVAGQTETDRANIFIAPGKYIERVAVGKPFVTFIGQGEVTGDVTVSFNGTAGQNGDLKETVSILGNATAFMARNLTFENSTPSSSAIQALALRCDADRAIFDNVRLLGFQDTLLVWNSARQYFRNSWISGDVDFIFGNATAVFDRCTIESTGAGYITAADTSRTTANGLIFLDCQLINGFSRAPNSSVFLGRPWLHSPQEQMPSVIFIRSRMWPHIIRAGWDPWDGLLSATTNRDPYTRYSECGSISASGIPLADANQDGTPDGRVAWADPMSASQAGNYTLANIFGPVEFWNAASQPETSTETYLSQGDPWNPETQLLSLPAKPGAKAQLFNISTRLSVGRGSDAGIGGFIVNGTEPKKVIVRAIGPSLTTSGLTTLLPDPVMQVYETSTGSLIATNDDWADDARAFELSTRGMAPVDEAESATIVTLAPGQYTAVVTGKEGGTGTALIEIYDGDLAADAQLANISTRGFVAGPDDLLIAGLVVGVGQADIIVRAIGPSLTKAGVPDALADPFMELHDGNGGMTSNDDWQSGPGAELIPVALQPLDARESALRTALAPGAYTVVVRGAASSTGVALVEAYNVDRLPARRGTVPLLLLGHERR